MDEKSQIQALDRTQPLLPMRPGQVEWRTRDSVRHGTTSLFAALDYRVGTVITQCEARHRAVEFRKFSARSQTPPHRYTLLCQGMLNANVGHGDSGGPVFAWYGVPATTATLHGIVVRARGDYQALYFSTVGSIESELGYGFSYY